MKLILGTLAIVLLGTAGLAGARDRDADHERSHDGNRNHVGASGHVAAAVSAPEINPASALAALALLGGGLMVLRGRRGTPPKA